MARIDYQSRDDFWAERKRIGSGAHFNQRRDDCSAERQRTVRVTAYSASQDEVWRQLAERIHGEFIAASWPMTTRVMADIGQWTITLDTYAGANSESYTTYTRLRAPYLSRDGFRFRIYRVRLFTALGDLLGVPRVRTGDPAFDAKLVVKSNDNQKATELLAEPQLRERLRAQPKFFLQVIDADGWFAADVDELHLTTPGVIKDLATLESLFDLLTAMLHRMCDIGSALDADPGVSV